MFNNPYMYQNIARPSLFSRLLGRSGMSRAAGGFNWGNILSNTQKSLGIINQAIPIVQQVKPIVNNAKSMFKIASILKSDDSNNTNNYKDTNQKETNITNKPIFYI